MTIYTSTTVEKKASNEKPHSIVFISGSKVASEVASQPSDEQDGSLLQSNARNEARMFALQQQKRRRLLSMLVCLIILLTISFIGLSLLKYFHTRMVHEEYQMWCEVRYDNELGPQEFQEEVKTDGLTYELLEVPEMGDFRQAVILHDFVANLTVIVDRAGGTCFVKPLNRATTKPPSDFWDLIYKLRSGYYMPNEEEVKASYRVSGIPHDPLEYGEFIATHCLYYDTYELEPLPHVNHPVKRSPCEVFKLRYIAGEFVENNEIYLC